MQQQHQQNQNNQEQQQMIKGALRLSGYDKPTIWTKFGALAQQTQPTNLGQGFPTWSPPQFFLDALESANKDVSQQYTRAYGTPRLTQTISNFYSPIYNRELDPNTNVLVANGGVACLNSIFMGLINPGEEVILLDPSYDCYAAQIQMAGGKVRSIPLKPRNFQTVEDFRKKSDRYAFRAEDNWDVDYEGIKNAINENTKAIVINSPHNPTGKIFTKEEYEKIADIIRDHNILVVEDQVYEHLTFENYKPFYNPRMALIDGMFDRCINVSSAGKLFSATGIRVGWAIGPAHLLKYLQAFHQYNVFCMHGPTQEAVAISLEKSLENGYFEETNNKMIQLRNKLIDGIVEGKQNFNLWIPQGGYFILCDIQNLEVKEKYFTNELFSDYKITKDLAYAFESAHEKKLLPIPCSVFYQPETKSQGEQLVRFAFCKNEQMLDEAAERFKNC